MDVASPDTRNPSKWKGDLWMATETIIGSTLKGVYSLLVCSMMKYSGAKVDGCKWMLGEMGLYV